MNLGNLSPRDLALEQGGGSLGLVSSCFPGGTPGVDILLHHTTVLFFSFYSANSITPISPTSDQQNVELQSLVVVTRP
jgi:hypothetical protein